jgi:hypothetical protein
MYPAYRFREKIFKGYYSKKLFDNSFGEGGVYGANEYYLPGPECSFNRRRIFKTKKTAAANYYLSL